MDNTRNVNTKDLSELESRIISGGSEATENITRLFGYIFQSFRNIDWTESSWFNHCRAQR